jgi:tetratricopeptide (TPR) repeat protein
MKTATLLLSLLLWAGTNLSAQHSYGPYSPKVTIRQEVGDANITIETNRPIARGRVIFGGLVPYDKLWHTGAGGTFITIDKDVIIAGQLAPASRYALYLIPTKKEWTVIMSRNAVMPDSPEYDMEKEVRVCIPVTKPGHFYEAWSIELDLTPGSAKMYLSWTDVQVSIPIETSLLERTNAFIDSLAAAPLTSDHEEYYRAVSYLSFNKQSMDKVVFFAKHIITLEKDERYYIYETLAEAYQYLGEREKALATLKKVEEILPREFPGQTETIGLITARVKKKLAAIEQME